MLHITEIKQFSVKSDFAFSCEKIIPWILILMGCSMLAFWILEIVKNRELLKKNSFQWKNEKNEMMWFHVVAELTTAIMLIFAGIAIWFESSAAIPLTLFSAGLLFYASLNSLSWVFAEKSRFSLAIPMIAGIVVSCFVLICFLI